MRGLTFLFLACVLACFWTAPNPVLAGCPCGGDSCATTLSVPVAAVVVSPARAAVRVVARPVAALVELQPARKALRGVLSIRPVRAVGKVLVAGHERRASRRQPD